jgi:hypothetical protein
MSLVEIPFQQRHKRVGSSAKWAGSLLFSPSSQRIDVRGVVAAYGIRSGREVIAAIVCAALYSGGALTDGRPPAVQAKAALADQGALFYANVWFRTDESR